MGGLYEAHGWEVQWLKLVSVPSFPCNCIHHDPVMTHYDHDQPIMRWHVQTHGNQNLSDRVLSCPMAVSWHSPIQWFRLGGECICWNQMPSPIFNMLSAKIRCPRPFLMLSACLDWFSGDFNWFALFRVSHVIVHLKFSVLNMSTFVFSFSLCNSYSFPLLYPIHSVQYCKSPAFPSWIKSSHFSEHLISCHLCLLVASTLPWRV